MPLTADEAQILAYEIEHVTAKRLADVANKPSRPRGMTWQHFYDMHAAVELGNLIFTRMSDKGKPIDV